MPKTCLTLIKFGQSKLQLIFGVWSSVSAHTSGHSHFFSLSFFLSLWPKWKRFSFPLSPLATVYVDCSTSLRADFSLRMNEGVAATPYFAVPIRKKCGTLTRTSTFSLRRTKMEEEEKRKKENELFFFKYQIRSPSPHDYNRGGVEHYIWRLTVV